MGRHSSTRQAGFYRSVMGWFLPWVIVAGVAITAMWVAVDALGGDEPSLSAGAPGPRDTVSPPEASPAPTPTPTRAPEPSEPAASSRPGKVKGQKLQSQRPTPALITEGITVQVLNGTASSAADDAMADRLAGLGFQIIAIGDATTYAQTTVFWSYPEAQPAAEALAARFRWRVAPKPENLSSQVDMHLVVGADYVP